MLKYYKNVVKYNEDVPYGFGIITGWKDSDMLLETLSDEAKKKIVSCGNLYTKNGINYIIANLFLNPHINELILIEDSSLNNAMAEGVEELFNFIQTGVFNFETRFLFTTEQLREFANYYKNHIHVVKRENLDEFIRKSNIMESNWCDISVVEEKEVNLQEQVPSEKVNFEVRADTVYEGWLRALKLIRTYGFLKPSDYDEKQLELIKLSMVIRNEDIDNPSMEGVLGITRKELEEYVDSLLDPELPDGLKYSYGSRFRNQNGKDQLEYMVKVLKEKHYSRRCVATMWMPNVDMNQEEVPCLNLYQAIIQGEYLYLITYIRANDVYNAWPRNIYGALKVQEELCRRLNYKKGYITTIAGSAHVYERNFKDLNELCENTVISYCDEDERGYFTVNVENELINVKFFSKSGILLREFSGKSASELRHQCTFYISNIDHAFYLGQELMKAELALQNNFHYVQDKDIVIKSLKL